MTYPAGVQLSTLTFNSPTTFLGNPVTRTEITVQVSDGVVWAATGDAIADLSAAVALGPGMPGAVTFPTVDQAGFTDLLGATVTMWSYVVTRKMFFGSASRSVQKSWQPLTGQVTFDFDNLPGGDGGGPAFPPSFPVSSVAGETGDVVASDLAGALASFFPIPDVSGKVGKGDLSYNVKDYLDVATAVAAAYADGRTLHWPYGPYTSTGSIPNLHKVRHTGNGWIVRGVNIFYPNPTNSQSNIMYADPAGLSTNDGLTPSQPMNRLSTIFSAWTNYGPVLAGNWTAQLAAGVVNDQAITSQKSANRMWVYGAPVAAGATPTTIFDPGATGFTKAIGATDYVNIGIQNVKAQNYTTAESPAFDFIAHTNAVLNNVWASAGDIGFRFMNFTKYAMSGCVSENNAQYGILELFGVVRDFKSAGPSNPSYLRGNGKVGIKAKELCTGHLDNTRITDNMHGVHFSRSSTANGTSAVIQRNQYGVTLRNQSSFVPLNVDWGFGTANANTITPWDVEGSSSFVSNENEAIAGKFSGRGEKLLGSFCPDPAYVLTGSTSTTTFATFGNLRQGSLARAGGYVKCTIIGSKGGTTGTATIDFRFGGSSAGTIVIPASTPNAFKIEVTIFSRGPGKQTVYAASDIPGLATQRVDRTYDVTLSDYLMSARATMANAGDSLTINAAWCYTTEALADES